MSDTRRVVCCSISETGQQVAERLPYEHVTGRLGPIVASLWSQTDAFVFVAPVGVAVRTVAPLLHDKRLDPAVVCVDDRARFSVAVCGGHAGGANDLAREVAALLGAQAVVTTATDGADLPGLDDLDGFDTLGDVSAVTRAWLDGKPIQVVFDDGLAEWPLPDQLASLARQHDTGGAVTAPWRIRISDSARPAGTDEVVMRPRSVVVGVGSSTASDPEALRHTVETALRNLDIDPGTVEAVSTIDRKASEPSIRQLAEDLGARLVGLPSPALESTALERRVPTPSEVVSKAVGTRSVAEAAALLAAGPGSHLLMAKQVSATRDSTVAIARRARPSGHLAVVGVGPGGAVYRTPEATSAVRHADVVIGYARYVDLVSDLFKPSHTVIRSPIGAETERCREALARAAAGFRVALVCSGDPGVYALASPVLELAPEAGDPPVSIIAGVTAASSAAALLGAPLAHDHAAVSLSDLLTPWATIVQRINAVADGDFVVSLYNPRSRRRTRQLEEAIAILSRHRPADTPTAVLSEIGRPNQRVLRTTLSDMDPDSVDMLSLVVIGSSQTRWIGTRMVTPRGYRTTT